MDSTKVLICNVCVVDHVENEEQYIQSMEKFGQNCVNKGDAVVGAAFRKFSEHNKEMTALFKNLVRL